MPIYEFYCSQCNTLLNFLSMRIDTKAKPSCPHCKAGPLDRRPARFATPNLASSSEEGFDSEDQSRLEGMMESMMSELDSTGDEEDPKKLASLFRRFGKEAGMEAGPHMDEFLARMEAGEDPDELESEMDSALGDESSLDEIFRFKKALRREGRKQPNVDKNLYHL